MHFCVVKENIVKMLLFVLHTSFHFRNSENFHAKWKYVKDIFGFERILRGSSLHLLSLLDSRLSRATASSSSPSILPELHQHCQHKYREQQQPLSLMKWGQIVLLCGTSLQKNMQLTNNDAILPCNHPCVMFMKKLNAYIVLTEHAHFKTVCDYYIWRFVWTM